MNVRDWPDLTLLIADQLKRIERQSIAIDVVDGESVTIGKCIVSVVVLEIEDADWQPQFTRFRNDSANDLSLSRSRITSDKNAEIV